MSPGCQIDGRTRQESLDAEIEFDIGDPGTLHDVITPFGSDDRESDPAEEAARNLDWQSFLAAHPPRHRTRGQILTCLADVFPCEIRRVRETSSISVDWEFLGGDGDLQCANAEVSTTMIYLHVIKRPRAGPPSPLDFE